MKILRRLAAAGAQALKRLGRVVDVQDLYVHGGLAVLGVGCWLAYPPSAGIVVGLALFWLGLGAPGIRRMDHKRREGR